jgi:hypothetical protein
MKKEQIGMNIYPQFCFHTPSQLVYGLHHVMPTKYVLPTISGDHKDAKPTRVLTSIIIKLEKLQENKLEVQKNVGTN